MQLIFEEVNETTFEKTVSMITNLMNYHRRLTNSLKEFWTTDEESEKSLRAWQAEGSVYNLCLDGNIVGFLYIRYGGKDAAWLEDLYIDEAYRSQGIGKRAFEKLDELMKEKGIRGLFVDVIPRNTSAIEFYMNCGFDHLNMIQLRKNYDERLNKTEEVEILGYKLKKY